MDSEAMKILKEMSEFMAGMMAETRGVNEVLHRMAEELTRVNGSLARIEERLGPKGEIVDSLQDIAGKLHGDGIL